MTDLKQCYVSFITNPHWHGPRQELKLQLAEIDGTAKQVMDASGFADATGIEVFAVFVEVAFYNPPNPGKITALVRASKKSKSVIVSWSLFPRNFPEVDSDWIAFYIALFADSIERALHKFKLDCSEIQRLKEKATQQIDLVEHFKAEEYSDWKQDAKVDKMHIGQLSRSSQAPELIAINHDDFAARYVGKTANGLQFFITNPFVPAIDGPGNEFVAMYLFDETGNLVDAKIDEFESRESIKVDDCRALIERRLSELGSITFGRIEVKPFSIEKFQTAFGLIPISYDDETGAWAVEAQPGNYMSFHEPWDSGEYDT